MGLGMKAFMTWLFLATCMTAMAVDAAISCDAVMKKLTPCVNYLKNGGEIPGECCGGVQSLNSMAQTTPDRRQACQCLRSAAQNIDGLQPNLASALPSSCGVNVPYPISFNTNCDNIK